jgi:hypothetical protein
MHQVDGTNHAPLGQVVKWSVAHQFPEASREGRARHRNLIGEFGDRPRMPWFGVH